MTDSCLSVEICLANSRLTPKFVKKYANIAEIIINAFKEYIDDVKNERFPEDKHVYHIIDSKEDFEKLFKEFNNGLTGKMVILC